MAETINPCIRKPVLKALILGAAVALGIYYATPSLPPEWQGMAMQAILAWCGLMLLSIVLTWAVYRFRFLSVNDDSIMMQTGVLGIKQVRIPYSRVTHSSFQQGIFDRVLGVGSLHIDTAGTAAVELVFDGIRREDAMALLSLVDSRMGKDAPS